MIGNIFISSALVVVVIFSTGALFKSLSDIKEAKEIQEHYEIVKDIKTLLAKQYNINIEDITRDDIIAYLPKGGNWEKVLLLDRQKNSNLSNKEFIDKNANITISKDEKIKLLALKAKLKDIQNTNELTEKDNKIEVIIGKEAQNIYSKQQKLDDSIKIAINFLFQEIVHKSGDITTKLNEALTDKVFFDYSKIEYDFETTDTTELAAKRKVYLKQKIKDELLKNNNTINSSLYEKLEGNL